MINYVDEARSEALRKAANGETMQKILKVAGVTQAEAAAAAGVSRATINNMVKERNTTSFLLIKSLFLYCEEKLRHDSERCKIAVGFVNERIPESECRLDPISKTPFSDVLCAYEVKPETVDLRDFDAVLAVCTMVLDPGFMGSVFYDEISAPVIAALKRSGRKAILPKRWLDVVNKRYGTADQKIEDRWILENTKELQKENILEGFDSDGQTEEDWRDTFYLLKEAYPKKYFVFLTGDTDRAKDALRANRKRPDKTSTKKGKPVRVLGYDGWRNKVPTQSDPEFITHWFSEWTPQRIEEIERRYDSNTGTYNETDEDKKEQW